MLAVELGLRAAIAAGYRNTVLTIHSDNTGVVKALRTGTTKNTEHNVILEVSMDCCILRAILVLAQVAAIQIDARWISTRDNPADNPSRGIFPSSIYSFQYPPPIPKHLAKHVDRILVYD
ncbi:hypothetical protein BD779DRAFT_1632856 [Infundibulicybe gibba]|nr:hypothetical protein BD779DRAFT_1632856 [Infundibulicybe gibba]